MKNILLLFLLGFATSGYSQLLMETEYSLSGTTADASVDYTFTVTNSGTETENFYWHLNREDGMPRSWAFTICDAVICYAQGTETSICNDPQYINVLAPGQSITFYKIGLHPEGAAGTHSVQFILTKVCGNFDSENVLATADVTFDIQPGSSTVEDDLAALSAGLLIYPNPTVDRFQIKNDDDVQSVAIYNIVGKQILKNNHKAGQSHDISDLNKGIYLVRMLDKTNQSLKVIRLTKD